MQLINDGTRTLCIPDLDKRDQLLYNLRKQYRSITMQEVTDLLDELEIEHYMVETIEVKEVKKPNPYVGRDERLEKAKIEAERILHPWGNQDEVERLRAMQFDFKEMKFFNPDDAVEE